MMDEKLIERLIQAADAADAASGGGYRITLEVSKRGIEVRGDSRADRHTSHTRGWDDIVTERLNPLLVDIANARLWLEPPPPARGPAYEVWTDIRTAREDVTAQARQLQRQGRTPIELVLNKRTQDHLVDLADAEGLLYRDRTAPTAPSFMGLAFVIDESVDRPTVR